LIIKFLAESDVKSLGKFDILRVVISNIQDSAKVKITIYPSSS